MTRQKEDEEPAEPSRMAGCCVLVVLGGGAVAAVIVAAPAAGVLLVWTIGSAALWRAARRGPVSDSSATPPPLPVAPLGDVFADESDEVDRVEWGPEGVVCIVHPKRVEVPPKEVA
ncbi:hypothetical protein ACFQ67_11545 [Streptomyces sp. NPDC056488]|uniref:hypothetical protein n=1 Tax=Streptomyces sp. NPDC056488 TaxID=3345836 RepID=UPI0036BE5A55